MKYRYLFILVAAAACWYIYSEYNRKPADLSSVKAHASVIDSVLVAMYMHDEHAANRMYLGKPVDVTGTVSEINNQSDTVVNVMLGNPDELHRVSCLMDANHINKLKKYNQGNKITIRGICTGFLMDVELNRCVIVK